MPTLNDVQSKLNGTQVSGIITPSSGEEISQVILHAANSRQAIYPASALHSMTEDEYQDRGDVKLS